MLMISPIVVIECSLAQEGPKAYVAVLHRHDGSIVARLVVMGGVDWEEETAAGVRSLDGENRKSMRASKA